MNDVPGTWCCEWEMSSGQVDALADPAGRRRARVLVRLKGEPLGYLDAPLGPAGSGGPALDLRELAAAARARFGDRIAASLAAEGSADAGPASAGSPPRPGHTDLVSVVVCTRDRSEQLAACLDRLAALTYPHLEVVVVDNAPSDDRTEQLVVAIARRDGRFRYVREPRPGLSRARNRGLAEARGTYLAYTDDDVAVDAGWVQGLLRGFGRSPSVGLVTGLVATADIAGAAEEYFDARAASWSTRCEPQRFALDGAAADDPLFPYSPGVFGTGANLAFDRALLASLGGFDEALGAGTRTRGGEDLDVFVRVLRAGREIAYEPGALVWHHHRADEESLLRQLFGYGTGLSAFLTKCLLQRGTRGELLRRVPLGVRRMAGIGGATRDRLSAGVDAPRGALRREFLGMAAGPLLYLQARRALRAPVGGLR